ncbi:MAG TPA: hypothetical protein VD815_08210 [Candidatus Saccharimonadales bacterium]|nr:hypothetical protein [Candidatus Saccharimonadales bacterium]
MTKALSPIVTIIITGMTILIALAILSTDGTPTNVVEAFIANQTQGSEPTRVAAGGGNGTAPLTVYIPENSEIKAG